MLVVEKYPWANTQDVTKHVEKALHDLRPAVSGMEMDPTLFRPATYLELAGGNPLYALEVFRAAAGSTEVGRWTGAGSTPGDRRSRISRLICSRVSGPRR